MKPRRRRGLEPAFSQINVTPLVDVMLVLLIVFMIAAPLAVSMKVQKVGMDQELDGDIPEEASLFVSAGGVVRRDGWLGQPVEDLAAWAAAALESTGEDALYLRGSPGIEYGAVEDVINKLLAARKKADLPLKSIFLIMPDDRQIPVTER